VKTLILTHISHRSRERDVLNEARAIFPNTYVARDFDRFTISKDEPVKRFSPSREGSRSAVDEEDE
jgi:ribonuclease Z